MADSTTPEPPAGLHRGGLALWRSLGQVEHTAAGVIALEACRTVDRLDEIDRVIAGKGVLHLMAFRLDLDEIIEGTGDRNVHVRVEFSQVLAEARQQAQGLRQLLEKLGIDPRAARPAGRGSGGPAAGGTGLDELARRRQPAG